MEIVKIPKKREGNVAFSIMMGYNIETAVFTWEELEGKNTLTEDELKDRVKRDNNIYNTDIEDEHNKYDINEIFAGQITQEIKGKKPKEACVSYLVNPMQGQRPETAILINDEVEHTLKGKYLKCFEDKTLEEILEISKG